MEGRDLGRILLEGAFIKKSELEVAQRVVQQTGKKLIEVLVDKNMVTPETLATILSFQYGVAIIDLGKYEIQPQALALIPEKMARKYNVLPLTVNGDKLTVAMDDPGDSRLIYTLSLVSRKFVRPVVSLHGGISAAINKHYSKK